MAIFKEFKHTKYFIWLHHFADKMTTYWNWKMENSWMGHFGLQPKTLEGKCQETFLSICPTRITMNFNSKFFIILDHLKAKFWTLSLELIIFGVDLKHVRITSRFLIQPNVKLSVSNWNHNKSFHSNDSL